MLDGELDILLTRALGLASPADIFPWQRALFARFRRGDVPSALDIPTGLGKTSVMALWLVARATGAPLPRRLVYVVDRRAVVDQATEVALGLRSFVEADGNVRACLGLDGPLPISTLRGQFVDNREWLRDPAAPAIIVGTVDMVGSRLLFEGYGVSRKMRPYHAGLLGSDVLVVLDEAHLVPPFEHLLRSLATDAELHPRGDLPRAVVPPFRLLTLSATGRQLGPDTLQLGREDGAHPVVAQRLKAAKALTLRPRDGSKPLENELAELAWDLCDRGQRPVRVVVYADSHKTARKTRERLHALAKADGLAEVVEGGGRIELFVGQRRVFERELARARLEELGFVAGSVKDGNAPAFLVATSAGEVGVDLDADHMVCDLVAWERMVQRLGRVNRRGQGEARVVVVPNVATATETAGDKESGDTTGNKMMSKRAGGAAKAKEEKEEEERQKLEAWRRLLSRLPRRPDGSVDASPAALDALRRAAISDDKLRSLLDSVTTREPLRPAVTRAVVEAWSLTSLREHTGRPAIQPWLRGWVEEEPLNTTVVWRRHLPVREDGAPLSIAEVDRYFEAAPVHLSERLESETDLVSDWLRERAASVLKRLQAGGEARESLRQDSHVAFVIDGDGSCVESFTLRELQNTKTGGGVREVLAERMLVVDARLGGLDAAGLLDEAADAVPRTADDGESWLDEGGVGFRVRRVEAAEPVLSDSRWRERARMVVDATDDGEAVRWLVIDKWRDEAATEDDRSTSRPQLLEAHQSAVEQRVVTLTDRLALPARLAQVLRLAARWHDEGKRVERWQRAFRAPRDGGIYAKTAGPLDVNLLDGYRHELGSLLRVERDPAGRDLAEEDRDLLLHLIAAHHGFGRPLIGTHGCDVAPPSVLEAQAGEVALRFARLQRQWGPWGLAWLEALLRAADQQASREHELGMP